MTQAALFGPESPSIAILNAPVSPARHTDPETAHVAAGANEDVRGAQRVAVLAHYRERGITGSTDYETGEKLCILRTSAGKRRKELCEAGLIVDSGSRRPTDTGSTAIVWLAAEFAGKAE